jgi:long-chain acyl-CoA synthetase
MEFASPEQRRLETIRSHIDTSPTNDQSSSLFLNATASSASPFFKGKAPENYLKVSLSII